MCSPEEFAVYSTGALEIPIIGMITGSIASVILPDLRRMVAAGDNAGALALFRKAAEKSAIFIIPIMMFLMVSAKPFILTLFSSKYADSVQPFRLYLLILPMRIVMFGSFLTALGLNKSILYRAAVGLTANAVMSVILVHRIGFIGAILATIISVCFVEGLWNVLVISRSVQCSWRRVLPFGVLWQLIWVSALACLPVMALIWAGVQMVPFIQLAINGVCFSVAFLGLIWIFQVEIIREEILRFWRKSLIVVRNIRANC
jgi:O-antigen/teichoic acid export membrane protein